MSSGQPDIDRHGFVGEDYLYFLLFCQSFLDCHNLKLSGLQGIDLIHKCFDFVYRSLPDVNSVADKKNDVYIKH